MARLPSLLLPLCLLLALLSARHAVSAQTTSLYQGSLRSFPTEQGWIRTKLPPVGNQSREVLVENGFNLNTQRNPADQVVYSLRQPGMEPHPGTSVTLDRTTGFRLGITLSLLSESHLMPENAGFRLAVISQDLPGVMLGFHTDAIIALDADLSPAERADGLTLEDSFIELELAIRGETYSLLAAGEEILTGPLRNLSGNNPAHEIPGMVYFGDADIAASVSVSVRDVWLAIGDEVETPEEPENPEPPVVGEEVAFTLVEEESRLSLSSVFSGQYPVAPQGNDSLVTTYSGELRALMSNDSIYFLPTSRITAAVNGEWEPGPEGESGTAPANYAGKLSIPIIGQAVAAVRHLELLVADSSRGRTLETTDNGTSFPLASLSLAVPPGSSSTIDLATKSLSPVKTTSPLEGIASGPNLAEATGSLNIADGYQIMELPVKVEFLSRIISDNDLMLTLEGRLVARRIRTEPETPHVPRLTIGRDSDSLVLSWDTRIGTSYLLERSNDLSHWESVTDAFTAESATLSWTLVPATPHSFFRVEVMQ